MGLDVASSPHSLDRSPWFLRISPFLFLLTQASFGEYKLYVSCIPVSPKSLQSAPTRKRHRLSNPAELELVNE